MGNNSRQNRYHRLLRRGDWKDRTVIRYLNFKKNKKLLTDNGIETISQFKTVGLRVKELAKTQAVRVGDLEKICKTVRILYGKLQDVAKT